MPKMDFWSGHRMAEPTWNMLHTRRKRMNPTYELAPNATVAKNTRFPNESNPPTIEMHT
jgi:hypothetical protein